MKITLTEDDQKLEITNDGFSVNGWVHLTLGSEDIDVHLNDLMPALIALDAAYNRQNNLEDQ